MKLLKRCIVLMLLLMSSVPYLYASHGKLGDNSPQNLEELKAAYDGYSSPGLRFNLDKRITQNPDGTVAIDFCGLNESDQESFKQDVTRIFPKEYKIFIFSHGNSQKAPTSIDEFLSAYAGKVWKKSNRVIKNDDGTYTINLKDLHFDNQFTLMNDAKRVLPDEKLNFIDNEKHGNLKRQPKNWDEILSAYDTYSSASRVPIGKRFSQDEDGKTVIELSALSASDKKKFQDDIKKVPDRPQGLVFIHHHGKLDYKPKTWEDFKKAYDNYSSKPGDYSTERNRSIHNVIEDENGNITILFRGIDQSDMAQVERDLKDLNLPQEKMEKIKRVYNHGNSKTRPKNLEELNAAYNGYSSPRFDFPVNKRFAKKDDSPLLVDLRGLSEKDVIAVHDDLINVFGCDPQAEYVSEKRKDLLTGAEEIMETPDGTKIPISYLKEPWELPINSETSTEPKVVYILGHGRSGTPPTNVDELIAAYSNIHASDPRVYSEDRVKIDGNKIIINFRAMRKIPLLSLRYASENLHLPKDFRIKYEYDFGNFLTRPKTFEDLKAAYNNYSSGDFPPMENRFEQKDGMLIVDLYGLDGYDASALRRVVDGCLKIPAEYVHSHGDLRKTPETIEEPINTYNNHSSAGFPEAKNQIVTDKRVLTVDLNFLDKPAKKKATSPWANLDLESNDQSLNNLDPTVKVKQFVPAKKKATSAWANLDIKSEDQSFNNLGTTGTDQLKKKAVLHSGNLNFGANTNASNNFARFQPKKQTHLPPPASSSRKPKNRYKK